MSKHMLLLLGRRLRVYFDSVVTGNVQGIRLDGEVGAKVTPNTWYVYDIEVGHTQGLMLRIMVDIRGILINLRGCAEIKEMSLVWDSLNNSVDMGMNFQVEVWECPEFKDIALIQNLLDNQVDIDMNFKSKRRSV
jgi:hypothetical protein